MLNVTHHQGNANENCPELYLAPVRMADLNRTANTCWRGCADKGALVHSLRLGTYMGAAAGENSMGLLKRVKVELSYDPAITLLHIYLKKMKALI